jgi:cytochrome P450
MSTLNLDRDLIRDLFDLRRRGGTGTGEFKVYEEDPHPTFHRLRETGPVHEGMPHDMLGFDGPAVFSGIPDPTRPHFSVFSFAECDAVFKNQEVFRSSPPELASLPGGDTLLSSMLFMDGPTHRRYRTLVQPSFGPNRAGWWMENWIQQTVHALIDGFESDKRAELNVDFDAAIPMLTITSSFGLSIEQALAVRSGAMPNGGLPEMLMPIVRARREEPQDDLISVLCQAEMTDDDGTTHRLGDDEILAFSSLLLTAGSGTTWKQLGITLVALLSTPGVLDEIRADRALLKRSVEESLRWNVTDPVFTRWVYEDTTIAGVDVPKGAAVHLVIGAANRDPERWENPDSFDIHRPLKPHIGFANGPHVCLGMHVARAEITTAVGALIDRLPNLRLDLEAEQPRIIGMYERGPSEINVLWE